MFCVHNAFPDWLFSNYLIYRNLQIVSNERLAITYEWQANTVGKKCADGGSGANPDRR